MRPALLALLALLVLAAPAGAAAPADYVRGAQNGDGGFGDTQAARGSNQFVTGWAALGLAAAGRSPATRGPGGLSAIAYLRRGLDGVRTIGDIERTVLVVRAAGLDPRRFAGRNLLREVLARRLPDGSIDGFVSYTSFGILAMRAGRMPRSSLAMRRARRWLERQQNADGGFNFRGRGGTSGSDDAGYALQALVAAGRRGRRSARRAAAFLARSQHADGGFPLRPGEASNAQSTAYAVQGLVAARARP